MAGSILPKFSGFKWSTIESFEQEENIGCLKLKAFCIAAIDKHALLRFASSLNHGLTCHLSPDLNMGGVHLVQLLPFENGTCWIARIQLRPSTDESAAILKSEIDTMALLRERSEVKVPKVFGYELADNNPVGRAFVLEECVPGNVAMDLDGGYGCHQGVIPKAKRPGLYRDVARVHVQITSVRLPKIGTVIRRADGSYDLGPLPKIGGPFEYAADFFEAWATHAKYPLPESLLRQYCGDFADQIISSIASFPGEIKSLSKTLSSSNNGPFPLFHPDFLHSNIVVDDEYNLLSIIDWEGACTLPWELISFPEFLSAVPASMDVPSYYDADGQPNDAETRELWRDRARYFDLVAEAEAAAGMDSKLSSTLGNDKLQHLGYAIREFPEGKMGFYHKVVLPFKLD